MKTVKISYEAVFNIGNYQSLRLGGEYTLEPKENADEAYITIDRQLREYAKKIIADRVAESKPQPQATQPQATQPSEEKPVEQAQPKKDEHPKNKIVVNDDESDRISAIGTALCARLRGEGGKPALTYEELKNNIETYYEASEKVKKYWLDALDFQKTI